MAYMNITLEISLSLQALDRTNLRPLNLYETSGFEASPTYPRATKDMHLIPAVKDCIVLHFYKN